MPVSSNGVMCWTCSATCETLKQQSQLSFFTGIASSCKLASGTPQQNCSWHHAPQCQHVSVRAANAKNHNAPWLEDRVHTKSNVPLPNIFLGWPSWLSVLRLELAVTVLTTDMSLLVLAVLDRRSKWLVPGLSRCLAVSPAAAGCFFFCSLGCREAFCRAPA